MPRRLIEDSWHSYCEEILLRRQELTPTEIEQARHSFYAGAAALFTEIISGLSPNGETTLEMMDVLVDIRSELRSFLKTSGAG